jgi:hypothetical protein
MPPSRSQKAPCPPDPHGGLGGTAENVHIGDWFAAQARRVIQSRLRGVATSLVIDRCLDLRFGDDPREN